MRKGHINSKLIFLYSFLFFAVPAFAQQKWESAIVKVNGDNSLTYIPDAQGNIIPDFSRVGYYRGDAVIPDVPVVKTISPSGNNDSALIQSAIDEVATMHPDKNGFRGTILLKKGTYNIHGTIKINVSGIVIRGEGGETKLIAAGTNKHTLVAVSGKGSA